MQGASMTKLSGRGFTLSELMIASAIMLIAILGLFTAIINCIFLNESNNHLVMAVNDAQYVLEQIKGLAYDNINDFITAFDQSQFRDLNNQSITFPNTVIGTSIANITVKVNWDERQGNGNFSLSTRIAHVYVSP